MRSKSISLFLTEEDCNDQEVTKQEICLAFKEACLHNNEIRAFDLISRFPLLLDFSNELNQNSLYWSLCYNCYSVFEKLLSSSASQGLPTKQEVLDNLFSILRITIVMTRGDYFKLIFPYWQNQLNPDNDGEELTRFAALVKENKKNYERMNVAMQIFDTLNYNDQEMAIQILLPIFKMACEFSENTAFNLINKFPALLDFSIEIHQNPLYLSLNYKRLSIFEKLLSTSTTQNFPARQEVLDNLFSILQINIENTQAEYFELIYPYWQKQLRSENMQKEQLRFSQLIEKNSSEYKQILTSIGNNFSKHALLLLQSRQGLFSPSKKDIQPPEVAKHIVSLAVQSNPGFS